MARGSIKGWDETKRNINKLARAAGHQAVRDGVYGIALDAAAEIRARIKSGKTGNLKRSVRARKFSKKNGQFIAFTAIDRKIEPHAHLVEFGHRTLSGSHVAAHPFFRPVMRRYRNGKYLKRMEKVMQGLVRKVRPDGNW